MTQYRINDNRGFNKKLLIVISTVIILAAGGVGAYMMFNKQPIDTEEPQTDAQITAKVGPDTYQAQESGDYSQVATTYDAAINDVKSSDAKRDLYLKKASTAIQMKQYDAAIEAAREAEKLGDNVAVSQMIAIAAELKQDNAMALVYYKKAITQFDKQSPMYKQNLADMEAKIAEIEAKS